VTESTNATSPPQHAKMNQFKVVNNCLQIGGQPLTEIAKALGKTPFYAYDRAVINAQIEALRALLPADLHLHYAVKANPMPDVVRHVSARVDGLDVASVGELRLALETGVDPTRISFAGPGKSNEDLRAAVNSGVIINMESPGEMGRIAALAKAGGTRPRVAIRVNPDFELKSAGMKMGSGPKPFGVDAEQVPAMLETLQSLPLDFWGFHIFSGSQNLRESAIIEAQTRTFELAFRLSQAAPSPVRWLNIGGGLGIPYFPGEQRLDMRAIAENLAMLVKDASTALPEAEIVMELGRYLVAEAGVYVCEVVDRKVSRGETFLVTNGGLHHHLAASGNFGQLIRKNYPLCLGNRVSDTALEVVNVVGPLCTPLDLLGNKVSLPAAAPGDLIVIFQSGAYGLTASPINFLSHPYPQEVLI
jgi:diaminopimelate decarboxylase